MNVYKIPDRKIKGLSPGAKREIIAVSILFCLAVGLSIPDYIEDRETARQQQIELQQQEELERSTPLEQGMDA